MEAAAPTILCHATPVNSIKVVCLLNQIAVPLILYGLELGLYSAALPPWWRHPRSWGFAQWCRRVILSSLAAAEPVSPYIAL